MEKEKSYSKRPPYTRRQSLKETMVGFARWKKIAFIGIFVTFGIFIGHLSTRIFRREVSPQVDEILPAAAQRAALIARAEEQGARRHREQKQEDRRHAAEEQGTRRHVHSRKKDMSIQFRDYIPRKIFINCGGTFPSSLDLFLDTYPFSFKYSMFSFIPDDTYSLLYSVYPSHKTVSPALCAGSNGTRVMNLTALTGELVSKSVPTLDIAQWILDNTHPDEHIVLKVDVPDEVEKRIVKRLVDSSAIESVNKFYTASSKKDVIDYYKKQFKVRGERVHHWDDAAGTFSDFDKMNPPRNPPAGHSVIKECGDPKQKKYPLFLYASEITPALNLTLNLLKVMSDFRTKRLPVAMFLPVAFLRTHRELLEAIFSRVDGGVYFNESMSDSKVENKTYVRFRNQFIAADNYFSSVGLILQHVVFGKAVDSSFVDRIVRERHFNVFVKLLEIKISSEVVTDIPPIQDYEIPVIDVTKRGSVSTVLYLLRKYEDKIMPLAECLKYVHTAE